MSKTIEERAKEYAQSNFRRDDDDKVILTAKELRLFICTAYKVGAKTLDSEVAALKAELEELQKTYTLESGGPY